MLSELYLSAVRKTRLLPGLLALTLLSACTFQPLYAPSANYAASGALAELSQVSVREVDSRVGQQVRNHLLFLINGGNESPNPRYEARLQISSFSRNTAAQASLRDTTAGYTTVTTSYSLIDTSTGKRIAGGTRKAVASFDRTSQVFANQRAVRDAENRAGKAVAEQIRLAIASDLRQLR
ncbi:MAG: hypothetical protein L3J32_11715 [Rhizobiaceae bacterium]|nr:hypothetical protein [Rhizobiaceae bacterium]